MQLKWILVLISMFCLFHLKAQHDEWNLDFENWDPHDTTPDLWHDTLVIENRIGLFPPGWHYRPDHIPEGKGLGRTTDATMGDYAVTLSGFYQYETMRIISGNDPVHPGWPIDYRPLRILGDYKAILLGDCDSLRAYVSVYLTKYNDIQQKRDTLGHAVLVLPESESYASFTKNIEYQENALIPDTVIISLAKTRFGFDLPPDCLECSHVFFDNLQLDHFLTDQFTKHDASNFNILPNPVKNECRIITNQPDKTFMMDVFNMQGALIKHYDTFQDELFIQSIDIGKGIYFLRLQDTQSSFSQFKKLIIN